MNNILTQISDIINSAPCDTFFLDLLFGINKQEALNHTRPIVLFGAGELGKELLLVLKRNNVYPQCFCDNDSSKSGSQYCNIPVISFDELKKSHKKSFIIIASQKYLSQITKQLIENGVDEDRVLCKEGDKNRNLLIMFSLGGTQNILEGYQQTCKQKPLFNVLLDDEQKIVEAYNLLADQKSKELFIGKLAFIASKENLKLYNDFMVRFSEPGLEFGFGEYMWSVCNCRSRYGDDEWHSEDYYYFNNDVFSLVDNEIYVDVGGFDGDTVQTFVQACTKNSVDYKRIYAFEPDPQNYRTLLKNTCEYKKITCHQLGLWSHSQKIRFLSSGKAIIDQAASINNSGDIEVQVVSLDDFLKGEAVTIIKMDPAGNVIPEAIKGATNTIAKHRPKLAITAYHSLQSIYEIPLLVNSICPDYKLYFRHPTYHLCDTILFAK